VSIKRQGEESNFSLGARELREATRAKATAPVPGAASQPARDAGGGFDPYNSSGSFDRKRNWEKVGKR
jgi:hypothetical protein